MYLSLPGVVIDDSRVFIGLTTEEDSKNMCQVVSSTYCFKWHTNDRQYIHRTYLYGS